MTRGRMISHLSRPVVLAVAMSMTFVWLFLTAFSQPRPHDLPVAVVGGQAAAAQFQHTADQRAPGVLQFTGYPSAEAARAAVAGDTVVAAFLPRPGGGELLVASAGGQASARVVGAALAPAGSGVTVTDVRPLPPNDSQGMSGLFTVLGTIIPSLLFALLAFQLRLGRGRQLALLLGYAVTMGLAVAVTADLVVGALTGNFWGLAATVALLALATAATALGLATRLGEPAIGLAALLIILIGLPASGGPVGSAFMPAADRLVGLAMPAGAAQQAIRSVIYFDAARWWQPALVLLAWAGAGILAVAALGNRATAGHPGGPGRHEQRHPADPATQAVPAG